MQMQAALRKPKGWGAPRLRAVDRMEDARTVAGTLDPSQQRPIQACPE